jgi:hypothetical protein
VGIGGTIRDKQTQEDEMLTEDTQMLWGEGEGEGEGEEE